MKVSVCMATYNGAPYVVEQLKSILPQLSPGDEVIVSDDCSSDDTVRVINGIGDDRVTVVASPHNLGYSRNFEIALSRATGDIIFVADQDDVWLPGKATRMLAGLEDHDLVVSDVTIVGKDLAPTAGSHFTRYGVRTGFMHNVTRTRYIGAAMAMRRPVLEMALPLPRNARLCAYDYWLTIVGEGLFDVGLIDEQLMLYRRHDRTASTGGASSDNSLTHQLLVRGYCLTHLGIRALSRRVRALSG